MDECLYSEFGFFNTTKVRSNKDGDFLTSPEVSEYFGFFIANFINENSIKKNILEIIKAYPKNRLISTYIATLFK